jgi:hypothetical protein
MSNRKILIETTMQYGDMHANPIEHVRVKNKESISFEYDSLYKMEPINRDKLSPDEKDQIKVPHDTIKFKYILRGESFLNYTWTKICYELNKEKNGILNLKCVYTNLDGEEEALLDTSEGKQHQFSEIIEFEDGEIIESVIIYLKNDILCGFDITTNKITKENHQRSILIGIRSEDVSRVPADSKVIIGIGCCANEQYGVSSIFFHRVEKLTFSIYQTYGLRQLRAKIKKNEEFVGELEVLKTCLNAEQKLLCESCSLPDAVFFSVLKYVMPY